MTPRLTILLLLTLPAMGQAWINPTPQMMAMSNAVAFQSMAPKPPVNTDVEVLDADGVIRIKQTDECGIWKSWGVPMAWRPIQPKQS